MYVVEQGDIKDCLQIQTNMPWSERLVFGSLMDIMTYWSTAVTG